MSSALQPGIQFPRDERGHHGTTKTAKAIFGAALRAAGAHAAWRALDEERDWRRHYPHRLIELTRIGAADGPLAITMARAALDEAWRQFEFVRANRTLPLAEAMRTESAIAGAGFATIERRGRGTAAPRPWSLPYRGRDLQGNEARDAIEAWRERGLCEPGHADALGRVLDHPEWFDLGDRTLVLLGAGSEAGPMAWLAQWRARIVAIDLPQRETWQRLVRWIDAGNATMVAPARGDADWDHAGADLLTDTPEIAAWLGELWPDEALHIGSIAYLDGERHVRVSMAMDAIASAACAARTASSRMFMATPTDAFAVPSAIASEAMRRYDMRDLLAKAAGMSLRALTGGRWLKPHVRALIPCTNPRGEQRGVIDALVVEQGPNYALAKRLQQWRATVARADGQHVAFNVAPSTSTHSVVKNPALKAGFDGAHHFGIEVFEPATTNALMAALWVHDLRCPAPAFDHPLDALTHQANHGGLWRTGYLPRSALPLAALFGLGGRMLR
jgi:hypothetical protein